MKTADSSEGDEIREAVEELQCNADEVRGLFGKKLSRLEEGASSLNAVQQKQTQLTDEVNELLERCGSLPPVARDVESLKSQADECENILGTFNAHTDAAEALAEQWRALSGKGVISVSQATTAQKEVDRLKRQLDKGRGETRQRAKTIAHVAGRVEELNR